MSMFTSAMADSIAAFIEFKHAMGVDFKDGEYILRRFDAFADKTGATVLNRPTVEGFICDHDRTGSDRHHLSCLRGFARFLQANGHDAHVISSAATSSTVRPATYLLSTAEIEAFFTTAVTTKLPDPWGWQASAFFGLMFACGLRTCEARRLNRTDIHYGDGVIDILWSKGPRSRRLPVSSEVVEMLANCDRENECFAPGRKPLFISGARNPLNAKAPAVMFRRIWQAADLSIPLGKPKPVPYALRHHFAYANIERWAAGGVDPQAMLPYLARYMGHTDVSSTYYYMHLSPDYAATYVNAAHASQGLIPDVSDE